MTKQRPIRLTPNKQKLAYSLGLAIVLAIGSLWIASLFAVTGICMGIFFFLAALIFGVQFMPDSAYLELREDGFTVCHLFRPTDYRWEEIESFGTVKFSGSEIVEWVYKEAFAAEGKAEQKLASRLIGTQASLPDTYGMSAEELAEMMNGYLKK